MHQIFGLKDLDIAGGTQEKPSAPSHPSSLRVPIRTFIADFLLINRMEIGLCFCTDQECKNGQKNCNTP
jgi:hypothetical protein